MVNIINNCIDKNVFPTAWKVARICPLPKIDNPRDVTKYRPILVLCTSSKGFERVILTQLCNYIEVKASCNLTQSGFRKGHSIALLLKLRYDIKRAMHTSELTLGILLDFSKTLMTILLYFKNFIKWNKLTTRLHLPSLTTLLYHKVAYWVSLNLYIVDIIDKSAVILYNMQVIPRYTNIAS